MAAKLVSWLDFAAGRKYASTQILHKQFDVWMLALQNYKINVGTRFVNEKQPGINYVDICENKFRSKLIIRINIQCIILQRMLQ